MKDNIKIIKDLEKRIFLKPNIYGYEGEFKANKYEGKGSKYYANGDIYAGKWKKGREHV
jgi:hypothetical protein